MSHETRESALRLRLPGSLFRAVEGAAAQHGHSVSKELKLMIARVYAPQSESEPVVVAPKGNERERSAKTA